MFTQAALDEQQEYESRSFLFHFHFTVFVIKGPKAPLALLLNYFTNKLTNPLVSWGFIDLFIAPRDTFQMFIYFLC